MARRHLTQEQRNEITRQQLRETPEKSDRQIAREIGVDREMVGTQRAGMEKSGEIKTRDEMIRNAIDADPSKSDRQIARELGISNKTVAARRKEAETPSEEFGGFPPNSSLQKPQPPVTVFNPTARQQRALRDERVVERMKETGSRRPPPLRSGRGGNRAGAFGTVEKYIVRF